MLLRPSAGASRAPLASLDAYRQAERDGRAGGARALEYETLALRVTPPEVSIDNEATPGATTIRVSSANRAGTLVSVCSVLISLSLDIRKAHISSDGGWFLDGKNGGKSGRRGRRGVESYGLARKGPRIDARDP